MSKIRIRSFYFAALMVILALAGLFTKGLNLGLDFTGGYLTEFSTNQTVNQQQMLAKITPFLDDGFELTSAGNGKYWTVRTADNGSNANAWLSDFVKSVNIKSTNVEGTSVEGTSSESISNDKSLMLSPQDAIYIGSQVGEELINQGGLALLAAIFSILLYLSLRFEWRLAMGAVAALFHDVILVLGLFAWLGLSFDLTILASILAIIGYSLNDSIIVGDRVREIMKSNTENEIDTIINLAIKSTLVRTLITSGTTLATIAAIWLFAGESLHGFAVALFSGILVGTYSSIAISVTVPQLLGLTADYYQQQEEQVCQLP